MHATWLAPIDHPAFAGHFPGRPILPGVVLLDRVILLAAGFLNVPAADIRLASGKFLSPVAPGEELHFAFQPTPGGAFSFKIRAADREVAAGNLAIRP